MSQDADLRENNWSIDDDIELDDECCPKCGERMYWRPCDRCDDGWITDLYEEDPLWYDEDDIEMCTECNGRGCHRWCRKCGYSPFDDATQQLHQAELLSGACPECGCSVGHHRALCPLA